MPPLVDSHQIRVIQSYSPTSGVRVSLNPEIGWHVVGNDIIDLHYFEAPLYHSIGYLQRVTAPSEFQAIRQSQDPALILCAIWAAKEAAFKFFSKQGLVSHFIPRQFLTDFSVQTVEAEVDGAVTYCSRTVQVRLQRASQWVHAIVADCEANSVFGRVVAIQQDGFPCHETESAAARKAAAELLASLEEPEMVLTYSGCIPYLRLANGSPSHLDVSLSHHGRFAAAAVARGAAQTMERSSNRRLLAATTMEAPCCTCMV